MSASRYVRINGRLSRVQIQADHTMANQAPPAAITKKSISGWAKQGLDISNSAFSKMHAKESKYEESAELYDLQPEKFTNFRNKLVDKMNTIHGRAMLTINVAGEDCLILTEYSKISEALMEDARNIRWPDVDPVFATQTEADIFTDAQIKASTLGEYIYTGLTENAKTQLRADASFFEVKESTSENKYRDGGALFWKIAEIVDPDNGHLVEAVREEIRDMNVKDFGFSVIKMLAHFKLLIKRLDELGGTYSRDEKFLDFWKMLKTMKEEEFHRYVKNEKDLYDKTAKADRGTLDSYIRDMQRKETAMRSDDEWNVMSSKDAMVMALVNMIEKQSAGTKKKSTQKSDKDSADDVKDEKPLTEEEKAKRRESKIPKWKKTQPSEDDDKTKEVDGRTYHWCAKCRKGQGMWALHKESDHKSDYKPPKYDTKSTGNKKSGDNKQSKDKEDEKGGPSVEVDANLMKNVKAYLSQLQGKEDFQ